MVVIAGGEYLPLYKAADGVKKVKVNAFSLDISQVTNQDYNRFIQKNKRWNQGNIKPVFADGNYLAQFANKSFAAIEKQAVTNVSWFSARAYCKAQGKRLPTTDEWEFAARASSDKPNGTDDAAYRQTILEWYSKPASEGLPDIDNTEVNFWGVRGMHGVVWELVNDFNTSLVTGESRADTQLDKQLFCGAGAASAVNPDDYAAFMRYALRSSYQAAYTMQSLGFRCAKDIDSEVRAITN